TKLEARVDALKDIVFHAKLGTQYERVLRIEKLAGEIAEKIGADVKKAKRAARLCKADLTTGVVGEFPELQGVMGGYYAEHDGEGDEVAGAVMTHYMPRGGKDDLPVNEVADAVSMADRVATMVGFSSIDEMPTGSGDPYAIRRAALGLIRIILERKYRIALRSLGITDKLLGFVIERLIVILREGGVRHDLVSAIFSVSAVDDLMSISARGTALQSFLKTDDGKNLLAGYKRAANILKAEEKKDGKAYEGAVDAARLAEAEDKAFAAALDQAKAAVTPALEKEDFEAAMRAMAALRAPVDAFFDKVKVNAEDKALRENRLQLLASLRATLHTIADFSKIEG